MNQDQCVLLAEQPCAKVRKLSAFSWLLLVSHSGCSRQCCMITAYSKKIMFNMNCATCVCSREMIVFGQLCLGLSKT